jgi:hypothetical protein
VLTAVKTVTITAAAKSVLFITVSCLSSLRGFLAALFTLLDTPPPGDPLRISEAKE